ncbi:MAG: hypothetical protein LRY69_06845 [Gammaproteobacteria bacterium]|nr:hypothetical protein [Gammaproteobacteria bacterium]
MLASTAPTEFNDLISELLCRENISTTGKIHLLLQIKNKDGSTPLNVFASTNQERANKLQTMLDQTNISNKKRKNEDDETSMPSKKGFFGNSTNVGDVADEEPPSLR